jgi:hypothetical protein
MLCLFMWLVLVSNHNENKSVYYFSCKIGSYLLMLQVNISYFRYQEEDRDLEAQMLAKGLRLTPLRKESHV